MGRLILHVGCGGEKLPPWLAGEEVRLDIDPAHSPDIVASMDDLGDVGPFDVVYSCHSLEHLHPRQAHKALCESLRVLSSGGFVCVLVPDLEGVQPTREVLMTTAVGEVTGRDMIYGKAELIAQCEHMAHKTGFTAETLRAALCDAGFSKVETKRLGDYNLFAVGVK